MKKNIEDEIWFKIDRVDYWEEYGVMPSIHDVVDMRLEEEADEE